MTKDNNANNHHKQTPDQLLNNIGPCTWAFMHTISARYPQNPTQSQQIQMKRLIQGIAQFFPCHYCARDFREAIKKHPIQAQSREKLSVWMCERHNEVNEKLGKPIVPCDRIWEKWGASPSASSASSLQLSNVRRSNLKNDDYDLDREEEEDLEDEDEDDLDFGEELEEECDFCEKTMGKERYEQMKKMFAGK
jgi:hypothetical protein